MEALAQLRQALPPWAFELLSLGNGLLLLLLIFVPLERLFALRPLAWRRPGLWRDLGYYFLSSLLPARVLALPVALLWLLLQSLAPQGLISGVADWPWALRLAAAVLVAEFGFYWGHRWVHASPWLWRFHAVHHSPRELDFLANTHAHPLDLVWVRLCGLLPLYVLGLAQPLGQGTADWVPLLVLLLASSWGYLIHANLRWRAGWLEYLVATPHFHHLHHERLPAGARPDPGNYAAMLPLMDMLFGSWRGAGAPWPASYGTSEAVPPAMVDQILAPFMGPWPPQR